MHSILVSAYGCEPFVGSEAGVGWNWVLQMAKCNKLYVITRANNREKIEGNIPLEVKGNISFYYYDTPTLIRKFKKRAKGLYLYYFIWQLGIIKIIKKILRENAVNYTMHLSFGSFWMPTFLPFFRTPFIWGPLGGGDCVPQPFLHILPYKERILQTLRYLLKKTSFLNPLVFYPSKKAIAILARTNDSALTVPIKYRNKVRIILETAMEDKIFEMNHIIHNKNMTEIIYAGRLFAFKNVISIVEAISKIPETYKIHLTIIGRGPEKNRLIKFIENNNLKNRVTLIDESPRDNVLKLVSESDIYLFPSLHEGGSWALMEAMAIGLPVICLDCTGMHTITTQESAIRLNPNKPQSFVDDMVSNIVFLIDNEKYRKDLGIAARKRIWEEFRWEKKGEFMENLLRELDYKSGRQKEI